MEHTKEPWVIGTSYTHEPAIREAARLDNCIAVACDPVEGGSPEANARRIVACVNACEGISTIALERRAATADTRSLMLADVFLQRDELLAVLEKITDAYEKQARFFTGSDTPTIRQARAAIAEVTKR